MPASVYIWFNSSGFYQKAGAGHAGLSFIHNNKEYYVTWFGTGNIGSKTKNAHINLGFKQMLRNGEVYERRFDETNNIDRFYSKNTGQMLVRPKEVEIDNVKKMQDMPFESWTVSLADEIESYKHLGHEEIKIPLMDLNSGGQYLQGLDTSAMAAWWDMKMSLPPGHKGRNYRLISKSQNCVSTVIEALLMGGMSSYAKPRKALFYYSVDQLRDWAREASAKMERLNTTFNHPIVAKVCNESSLHAFKNIPTLTEWKRESARNVTMSFMKRRLGPIKVLDSLIPLYHAENNNITDKLATKELLVRMLNQCFKHLILKERSDRRAAVLQLAYIVHAKLKNIEMEILAKTLAEMEEGRLAKEKLLKKPLETFIEEEEVDDASSEC